MTPEYTIGSANMKTDHSKLKRRRHPMPDFVSQALEEHGLMQAYRNRPPYQQNDYLGWIGQAQKQETKERRLKRMLDELKKGGVYMNMTHPPSAKT